MIFTSNSEHGEVNMETLPLCSAFLCVLDTLWAADWARTTSWTQCLYETLCCKLPVHFLLFCTRLKTKTNDRWHVESLNLDTRNIFKEVLWASRAVLKLPKTLGFSVISDYVGWVYVLGFGSACCFVFVLFCLKICIYAMIKLLTVRWINGSIYDADNDSNYCDGENEIKNIVLRWRQGVFVLFSHTFIPRNTSCTPLKYKYLP